MSEKGRQALFFFSAGAGAKALTALDKTTQCQATTPGLLFLPQLASLVTLPSGLLSL